MKTKTSKPKTKTTTRKTAPKKFAALILTHGRPDSVTTYRALRKGGYTGPIVLVVDDLDATREQYVERYGDQVVVFDKRAAMKATDTCDNFSDHRAIVFARNASFGIAKSLGYENFIQLDDDYTAFYYRFDQRFRWGLRRIRNLDAVFGALVEFWRTSGIASIAMAQGGDYLGGEQRKFSKLGVQLHRKCMNSFVCGVERPFKYIGRLNEDVSTYARLASTGLLLVTTNQLFLVQGLTQHTAGGMSEVYLDAGTYVKSFYSVMCQPSSVRVFALSGASGAKRLHHRVRWRHNSPLILHESLRKTATTKRRSRSVSP